MDIYSRFRWHTYGCEGRKRDVKREALPKHKGYSLKYCEGLTDYGYWFFSLSTLWVSYSGIQI